MIGLSRCLFHAKTQYWIKALANNKQFVRGNYQRANRPLCVLLKGVDQVPHQTFFPKRTVNCHNFILILLAPLQFIPVLKWCDQQSQLSKDRPLLWRKINLKKPVFFAWEFLNGKWNGDPFLFLFPEMIFEIENLDRSGILAAKLRGS